MRIKEGNKEIDILDSAIKVFAKEGFHQAKISRIAEDAGVATGSVYLYYKNKEDLLISIFKSLWERLYVQLKVIADNKNLLPEEKVDSMLEMIFDLFTEDPALAIVFVNEQHHLIRSDKKESVVYYEKFLDEGEKVIREGIDKNYFNKKLDLKIFRQFILGAVRNLLHQWASNPKKYSIDEVKRNIKQLTKFGIMVK